MKKYESTRVKPANSLFMIGDQDNTAKKKAEQVMKYKTQ
jgi:hypothetical protein